jgi:xylan 1,4-beta-xylosidase
MDKCKKPIFFLVMLWLTGSTAYAQHESFIYQNPVSAGIDTNGLRDCQVFRDGDYWYMTGTSYPHWEREELNGNLNKGVVLYRSKNITQWEFVKYIIERPDNTKWYYRRFWAPEIQKINGKYYATFNCSNPVAGYPGQHIGYAVADKIDGPYTVITDRKPLSNGNDLTLFQDDDGKVYAFWNRGREFGIGFAEIDLEKAEFKTKPQTAIQPSAVEYDINDKGDTVKTPDYDGRPVNKVKKYSGWDAIGIEGAYVIKQNNRYYLFYSSWTRGYEIGYATSNSIKGPWIKNEGNPFYGAQSKATCQKNGMEYTGDENSPFNQVGHNQIFKGPDSRFWLSCHGILKANEGKQPKPFLVIDPIGFDKNGNIKANCPTYTRQIVKIK